MLNTGKSIKEYNLQTILKYGNKMYEPTPPPPKKKKEILLVIISLPNLLYFKQENHQKITLEDIYLSQSK